MSKAKQELSGLLVVDKPQGVTSHDVVGAVRGALHMRRVGHAGTLDPMATGVLVIGFGHATRLLNYIVDHHKTYEATIRLGQTTTTDDADGDIVQSVPTLLGLRAHHGADAQAEHVPVSEPPADSVAEHGQIRSNSGSIGAEQHYVDTEQPVLIDAEQIKQTIAEHLTGRIEQVPSAYSAIKVDGKRAYDLARSGVEVELTAREVTISDFQVLAVRQTNPTIGAAPVVDVDVQVSCSAGTYIRSLGRDLGQLLGAGGHLTRLRRLRIGRFESDGLNVVTAHVQPRTFTNREGEQVTRNRVVLDADRDALLECAYSMLEAVQAVMPTLEVSAREAQDLRYGRRLKRMFSETGETSDVSAAYIPQTGEVIALVSAASRDEVKPVVVFPAQSATPTNPA